MLCYIICMALYTCMAQIVLLCRNAICYTFPPLNYRQYKFQNTGQTCLLFLKTLICVGCADVCHSMQQLFHQISSTKFVAYEILIQDAFIKRCKTAFYLKQLCTSMPMETNLSTNLQWKCNLPNENVTLVLPTGIISNLFSANA